MNKTAHRLPAGCERVSHARLERFADLERASLRAATLTAEALRRAALLRGRASLALSGGSTPGRFFELLSEQALPWNAVRVFWADERLTSLDAPLSNYRLAQKCFLSRVPVPRNNIHPLAGEGEPKQQAHAYEALLREAFPGENPPSFDVIHLGIGDDGHTASLFPGQSALFEQEHWVIPVEYAGAKPPLPRLTLTLPVLNAARLVIFLACGPEKQRIAEQILSGQGEMYPASFVRPAGELVWLVA